MLNLDHPRTRLVFAASRQIDLILDYCKRMTLSGETDRHFMMEVVRPAFAALRWLAEHRFADEPHIAAGLTELERQVEQLATLPMHDPHHRGVLATRCPVCGGKPTTPSKYDPIAYCLRCLDIIRSGLARVRSCEQGFGTDAI